MCWGAKALLVVPARRELVGYVEIGSSAIDKPYGWRYRWQSKKPLP